MPIEPDAKRYNTEEAAEYLGMNANYLIQLRGMRSGPSFYRDGRYVFYLEEDLQAWRDRRIEYVDTNKTPEESAQGFQSATSAGDEDDKTEIN